MEKGSLTAWLKGKILRPRVVAVVLLAVSGLSALLIDTIKDTIKDAMKHVLAKRVYDSAPALSYQVLSVKRVNRSDLDEYVQQELHQGFNLALDDSILTDYAIFKVAIRNRGTAV